MKHIIILIDFKFAERGVDVIEYLAGPDAVEVSDECADVAIDARWAKLAPAEKPARQVKRTTKSHIDPVFSPAEPAVDPVQTPAPDTAAVDQPTDTPA